MTKRPQQSTTPRRPTDAEIQTILAFLFQLVSADDGHAYIPQKHHPEYQIEVDGLRKSQIAIFDTHPGKIAFVQSGETGGDYMKLTWLGDTWKLNLQTLSAWHDLTEEERSEWIDTMTDAGLIQKDVSAKVF